MNTLKSKVKQKNSLYFDIAELAYIPEREVNEDVLETGVMINPIEVYMIDKIQAPRYGAGGVLYRLDGCVGKNYLVQKYCEMVDREVINPNFYTHFSTV